MSDCPLDVDLRNKLSNVGVELEPGIRIWIEGLIGARIHGNFAKALKNGVILCKYVKRKRKKNTLFYCNIYLLKTCKQHKARTLP
jgi:hypothetical protein